MVLPEPLHAVWPIDRGPFSIEPWRKADDPNGKESFTYFRARARYEIELEFLILSVESFERSIKRMRPPADSREEIEYARQSLRDVKEELGEFSRECTMLIETRGRIIAALASKPEGIERSLIKKTMSYRGRTPIGVICNQMSKGCWALQTKLGNRFLLRFAESPPVSNREFLAREISPPRCGPSVM
jgi:hypothetical protein